LGDGFLVLPPNSPSWEIQSLRFVGVNAQFMNGASLFPSSLSSDVFSSHAEVSMSPSNRSELLTMVNSERHIPPTASARELCTKITDADRLQEKREEPAAASPPGGVVQRVYVGLTCYSVVLVNNTFVPYYPTVIVRTTVIVRRGVRRHYIGYAPTCVMKRGIRTITHSRRYWFWYGRTSGGYYHRSYSSSSNWRSYHHHHHHHFSSSHAPAVGGFGGSHHASIGVSS
jgi:hypothetical protein